MSSRLVTLGKDVIAFVLNKINALSGGELTIAAVLESARTFKKKKENSQHVQTLIPFA